MQASLARATHRPGLIRAVWHSQWLWLFANQPFLRLDAQVQFKFTINPPDTLVVPCKAFDIAQIQITQAEALGPAGRGQTHQTVRYCGVLIAKIALVAIAALTDLECAAD
jgi:hypothetical protein